MKIQTFSVVVGSPACDAHCPFCVSKMTGMDELPPPGEFNERNLDKAIQLAKLGGTTTGLLTGKGEPCLYPDRITEYLRRLSGQFPFIELQTNGIQIGRLAEGRDVKMSEGHLKYWYEMGLDTLALSVTGIDPKLNRRIYNKDYPNLDTTIEFLHDLGYSVRLCVMLMHGEVDSVDSLKELIRWCFSRSVDQLTIRPIKRPQHQGTTALDVGQFQFVQEHGMADDSTALAEMHQWVQDNGTLLLTLMHGARVYDLGGQNICVSDCLTVSEVSDDIRTLIYYGNGRIAYDWQHRGGVLLGGHNGD